MKEMDTRTNIMVTEIIPKLLTLGCAVENVMDTSMPSPLLEASRLAMMDARPNHWDLITTLIQGGANVNASWPGGDIKINCNNSYVDLWETPGDTFFHRLKVFITQKDIFQTLVGSKLQFLIFFKLFR